MKCGASNAIKAERCRKCRSTELRRKAKEGRGV
ncbi:MAG: 50S ribosomal protein L40e, partial [Euryarchaeota archaeon]|nr:50S ribosomal protein L40e [Euryarchaeota archaeon]